MKQQEMSINKKLERVAFIGGGISAIAAASVWKRCGFEVVIFEAGDDNKVAGGGQWNDTYPNARVQNTYLQYQFAEFPWPFQPDRHPTSDQVLRYIQAFCKAKDIRVQFQSRVTSMTRNTENNDKGVWVVTLHNGRQEHFDCVQIAIGQFPPRGHVMPAAFAGIDRFRGTIFRGHVTTTDYDVFDNKRVVVIGFGKTALDLCTFAAPRAKTTTHIFRTPRWLVPDRLLGVDFSIALFCRALGTELIPAWHHSWWGQRILHTFFQKVVDLFWRLLACFFWSQHVRDAKLSNRKTTPKKSILDPLRPPSSQFVPDMRSATALAPPRYFEYVAHGLIQAKRSEVSHLDETGIVLQATGEPVDADIICVCCGSPAPAYPFLPEEYRTIIEHQSAGPSLYRFAIDPRIPDVGFVMMNSFAHLAMIHLSALWQVAVRQGVVELPSETEMLLEMKCVEQWKCRHSNYEPSRNLSINTRFQQMADLYCTDLGLSMFRKMPNIWNEMFARYDPTDYADVVDEYIAVVSRQQSSSTAGRRKTKPMTCVVDTQKEG